MSHASNQLRTRRLSALQMLRKSAAVEHLQTYERLKLMRGGTIDAATDVKISGDILIGELLHSKTILIPMPIDPHGKWGPMTNSSLRPDRPNHLSSAPTGLTPPKCTIWPSDTPAPLSSYRRRTSNGNVTNARSFTVTSEEQKLYLTVIYDYPVVIFYTG